MLRFPRLGKNLRLFFQTLEISFRDGLPPDFYNSAIYQPVR